jgi:hypothetical protein
MGEEFHEKVTDNAAGSVFSSTEKVVFIFN